MKRTWQLQEAKNKFSEVVEEAVKDGPQVVTKRGVETVVILSYSEYVELTAPQQRLSAFFRESPLVEVELDLRRDTSGLRPDVAL
jgi:prevent-host-death family protein